jgi:tetratricopeptide (TPR) repeat protein
MIVDNADDPDVFFKQYAEHGSAEAARSLSDFLPQSQNGSIVITSRSRDVAFKLLGRDSDIIIVKPMDQDHALALLHKKLKGNLNMTDAAELVQTLDYMPLAINQAAAYISQRTPRVTVSKYLHDFRGSEKNRASLLQEDIGDIRRDSTASNSIIATWQISFEHIRKERSSAARLLSLMSLFDRQRIPEALLLQNYQDEGDVEANFEDDLSTLISYSLVTMNIEGNEFEMHRLVQFSTKKWLELYNELENWKEKYISIMDKAFPTGQYENWATCRKLFPHAEMVLLYWPTNEGYLAQWASVLFNAAWYSNGEGSYDIAEKMNRQALEGRKKALGKEHPFTLASIDSLAVVLRSQGKYEQAEEMSRQAVEGRERALGKEHSDTLTSVNNLAVVLQKRGKDEQAEEMNRRVLKGYEKALGKDHLFTLTSVNNLAIVLEYQGKYEQAEEMHRRSLEGREKALGKDHPSTLESMDNLATVLRKQGKYEQAEEINRRALVGCERALGKEHSDTLTSVNNLAMVLLDQGKYEQAEEMNRRALEGREKALGKDHPSTLISVYCLAYLLHKRGQYQEASPLYQRACAGFKKALGQDHPTTKGCSRDYSLLLEHSRE